MNRKNYLSLLLKGCAMGMADADMKLSEHHYVQALQALDPRKTEFPDLSAGAVNAAFPGRCQSLTQVLSTADARLTALSKQP